METKDTIFSTLPIAGLLDLANAYCESQLKRVCERIIKQGITIENTAMLYAAAIKYEAKVRKTFNLLKNLNLTVSLKKKENSKNVKLLLCVSKNWLCYL